MIREFRMHSRDIGLRHVAASAVRGRHRTNSKSRIVCLQLTSSRRMARQTSLVVKARVVNQRLVRIVTSDAGQASISPRSPAPAFLQTIWLEADINRPVGLGRLNHIDRGPVAGSTKVHRFDWTQIRWIENGLYCIVALIGVNCVDVR